MLAAPQRKSDLNLLKQKQDFTCEETRLEDVLVTPGQQVFPQQGGGGLPCSEAAGQRFWLRRLCRPHCHVAESRREVAPPSADSG